MSNFEAYISLNLVETHCPIAHSLPTRLSASSGSALDPHSDRRYDPFLTPEQITANGAKPIPSVKELSRAESAPRQGLCDLKCEGAKDQSRPR